jgi:hypothetical protein
MGRAKHGGRHHGEEAADRRGKATQITLKTVPLMEKKWNEKKNTIPFAQV